MYICINGTLCFLLVFFSVSLCVVGMLMMMMRWSPFASDQIIFFFLLSVCVSLSSLQLLQCTHTKHLLLIFCYFRSFLRSLCREKVYQTQFFVKKNHQNVLFINKNSKQTWQSLLSSIPFSQCVFIPYQKNVIVLTNIFYTFIIYVDFCVMCSLVLLYNEWSL